MDFSSMIHMLFLTLVLQSSRVFLNFMNKVAKRLVLGFVWLMIILGVEKMIPNFQEKKISGFHGRFVFR